MPDYKTHLIGGSAFAGISLAGTFLLKDYRPDPLTAVILCGITILFSLFPDTDTDSKGQNTFFGILVGVDLYLLYTKRFKWAAILGFCGMLPALGHHRGWTHTLWAMVIIPAPIVLVPYLLMDVALETLWPYYAAALIGYFSHLVLDRKFW